MRHILYAIVIAALLAAPLSAFATPRCDTCERDSNGRIQRSASAIKEFKHTNPCPATGKATGRCSGWVVDHKKPLCAHGADSPENMVWSPIEEANQKDKEEMRLCRMITHGQILEGTDRDDLCQALEPLQWPLLTKALCDGNRRAADSN